MDYYGHVVDGEIVRVNITLPCAIGNTWVTPSGAAEHGLLPITGSAPAYDPATQRCSGPTYQVVGSEIQRVYVVESIPLAELKAALITSVTQATQQRLDDFARTRNYDGILSACTYATSTVPQFAAEGQYCVERRDATWAKLYNIMTEVEAGTRPMPTGYADIEAELPSLVWPA